MKSEKEIAKGVAVAEISRLTDEVLDDYNLGKYTPEELKKYFAEREEALKEWE